jgi:hypothetical protein
MGPNELLISSFLTLILLVSVMGIYFYIFNGYEANGNGFSRSNMVCSTLENNTASFCGGILPIILKGGSANNFAFKIELYDYVNRGIFPNTTYDISLIKNEYDQNLKDSTVLSGIFNTRNGIYTIYINSSGNNSSGKHELKTPKEVDFTKFNSSIRADSINLSLPFELESGQYRVQSVVYVQDREPLHIDADLQVGETESKNIFLNKSISNVTVISYYDKITDLIFDTDKRTISWKIPFEYNASKIENGKVSVHQEIIIPDSFLELTHTKNFSMTMNDNYFDSSYFYVDPYSYKNKTVIHYVPNTNTLFDMSYNKSKINNHMMKFSLFL